MFKACYEFCRIHKAIRECNCIPVEAPDEVLLNTTVHSVCNESKISGKSCQFYKKAIILVLTLII